LIKIIEIFIYDLIGLGVMLHNWTDLFILQKVITEDITDRKISFPSVTFFIMTRSDRPNHEKDA